jgi:hypothetical protein
MSSTVGSRIVTGTIIATNAVLTIETLEFTPKRVVIENHSNNCKAEWNNQMADASVVKTIEAGTRSLVAAAGITPVSGTTKGFSIGALADINDTTTESLKWVAYE